MANALFFHVAILSTMFSFEGSVKCIVKHCPAVKNFLSYAIKVCSLVYRRNHHDPHPVVQQSPPFVSSLTEPRFSRLVSLQKVTFSDPDNILIGFRPHQLELDFVRHMAEEPCLPPFMGAHRKGLIFVVPPR